tara:strand:- start:1060 stop:2496 length:1437 start_codon:yes stop_codon:yes gene_type:complete
MALITIKNAAINLDASEIPNLDASKITSGQFADARISSSSVVAHSPQTDLQPVKSDISALALREATNESSAAFNLPNQHIDTFATDTLGTKTNVAVSDGYISSVIPAGFTSNNSTLATNLRQLYLMDNALTDSMGNQNLLNSPDGSNNITFNSSTKKLGTHSAYFDGNQYTEFGFDNGSGAEGVPYFHTNNSNGSYPPAALSIAYWAYWTPDNGNWNMVFDGYHMSTNAKRNYIFAIGNDDNGSGSHDKPSTWDGSDQNWGIAADGGSDTPVSAISKNTWVHIIHTLTSSTKKIYINGSLSGGSQSGSFGFGSNGTGSHIRIGGRRDSSDYQFKGYLDQFAIWDRVLSDTDASNLYNSGNGNAYTALQSSATGTAIQAANTVGSAKTKVGGTLLYKNLAGTNTLGTDLKVYFTCNGGTNWTEASSYNAITPVYSTGVKQVRLGETTCTSGSDVRYKIEWANQADGSKVAQVHGIGVNY